MLRSQALAAAGAAALEDGTTGFRCHAGAETVGAGAFQVAWLESAFHVGSAI
jgi:hypothetical protein